MSEISVRNTYLSASNRSHEKQTSRTSIGSTFQVSVFRQQNRVEKNVTTVAQRPQMTNAAIKDVKAILVELRNLVDQLLSSVSFSSSATAVPSTLGCACPEINGAASPSNSTSNLVQIGSSWTAASDGNLSWLVECDMVPEPEDPAELQFPQEPNQPSGPETPDEPVTTPSQRPMTDLSSEAQNKPDNAFIRIGPSSYEGNGDQMAGADRPNPRAISNAVAAQNGERTFASNGASALLWSWGQFVDHDINLSKEGHEEAPIAIPKGDPSFDPQGTGDKKINFERSDFILGPDGKRQQINEQTPFVDASMIYGADTETTNNLRAFEGGKMLVSEGNHLPVDADGKILAGDKRAGEQPGLTALHTLFVREHNRMAAQIASQNPEWTDNQIFDAAKRYVTMEVQAITYNEFLPTLLGDYAPSYLEYVAGTDGRMSNEFATAGYRLGHTMVNETVMVRNEDGSVRDIPLRELFFSPNFLQGNGVGSVLGGMAGQTAEAVDPMVVDSLRNALFGPPGSGGLDLASLNIQRGRDHGLPTYNDMRESMGLSRIESFDDPIFQGDFGARMASVYDSPDDVDLWVGALAEDQIGNSMLGQTMTYIVAGQFAATAAADPNFFANQATSSEMAWLSTLTLSDVIRWNSTNSAIDDTAFIANDNQNNYGW